MHNIYVGDSTILQCHIHEFYSVNVVYVLLVAALLDPACNLATVTMAGIKKAKDGYCWQGVTNGTKYATIMM